MRFLDNLKISVKILSVIGLLSAVTALVVVLGALSLHGVDQTYTQLAAKEEPAVLALARGARSVNILGYATYRAIAYPGNSPEGIAAGKSVESNSSNVISFLKEAEELNPENKQFFDDFLAKAQAINSCVTAVVALGLKDDNDNATKAMVKCDALIGAFTSTASNFANDQIDKAKAATAAASASATTTIITTSLIGIIGLAICGMLGLWIAMAKITKPLVHLGDNMKLLAEGDLTTEIAGQDRGDEVGTMAKAVQVFKDNALALKEAEAKSAEQQRAADEQRRAADEERRRNEEARAEAAAQVARVVQSLGAGLERMARGDLSYRLSDQFAAEYIKIRDDFNGAIGQLQQTISAIVSSTREVTNASAEISTSTTNLSQRTEEQAASHGADRGILAQDRRHYRRHRRDRASDQSARAQCRGRGGARRRSRPRFRGGGFRSAQPCAALVAGRQGHQGPHHQQQQPGEGWRRARQQSGGGADRDRYLHQEGGGDRG
jgi:methyl-accepting chemotaxis protein